jgi:hypothetical protein
MALLFIGVLYLSKAMQVQLVTLLFNGVLYLTNAIHGVLHIRHVDVFGFRLGRLERLRIVALPRVMYAKYLTLTLTLTLPLTLTLNLTLTLTLTLRVVYLVFPVFAFSSVFRMGTLADMFVLRICVACFYLFFSFASRVLVTYATTFRFYYQHLLPAMNCDQCIVFSPPCA